MGFTLVVAAALAAPASGRAAPAAPPPPEPPPAAGFADEVSVAWILVPVTVQTRGGRFVKGLEREDFELRVDGRRVSFPDFEPRGGVPWSLVFLQDLSGSMALSGKLEASQRVVRFFFDLARGGDEFALASFAGPVTAVDVPFTEDQSALRETVARWEGYGKTALHDAVALLPQISGSSRNLKRAVVLITDGADNASQMTAAQAREVVRRAEIPVFVLGLESGDPKAVSAEGDRLYRFADVLNLLATETGGRFFPILGPADLTAACAAIEEELRSQYVLGFETSGRGASRYRPISVEVRRRNVKVTHRQGYRGTRPAP
jgi:VWFA-related protein